MILRRLVLIVFILFAIISMTYAMIAAAPGSAKTSERSIASEVLRKQQIKEYEEKHNYRLYLKNIIRGDLGTNKDDIPIEDVIGSSIPVSFTLGALSILTAVLSGILAGVVGAYYQNQWPDRFSMLIALVGLSIPAFVMGPLLQMFFGLELNLLNIGGWWNPFDKYDPGNITNLILPTFTLALIPAATIARLTRSSMLEAISQDYMRTAISKGLGRFAAVIQHGLKNACLPVLSYLGPATASVLTGSIVVEKIFDIPGLGKHFILGAINRDYELVLSTVLIYASLLLLFNLVIDVLYGVVDPRIKEL